MITIPEPCHEDFNKMLPTERGAFCSKCKIDTYDFKEKSEVEIAAVFLANKGKHLCGQFTNKQLGEMETNFNAWKNQNSKTFRSKFVLALILVFGLTLFSCNQEEEEKMINSLESISLEQVENNYISPKLTLEEEVTFELHDYVKIPTELNGIVECQLPMDEEEIYEEPLTSVELNQTYTTAGVLMSHHGGAAVSLEYSYEYMTYLVDSTEEESLLPEVIENDPYIFEAKAFPNPTSSFTNVQLEIEKEGMFEVALYAMSGQLIQSIYAGELVEGRQQFEVDLSNEQTGMYLITVRSGKQLETLKIQRL